MTPVNICPEWVFSHRDHFYTVVLRECAGGYWGWSYVVEGTMISGTDDTLEDEVTAITRGMAAAAEYIDRMLVGR